MRHQKRTLLALLIATAACSDGFGPVTSDLSVGDPPSANNGDRVIVTLSRSARPEEVARGHGLQPDFVFTHVLNGFAARLPAQAREGLMRNPHVERIEPDVALSIGGNVQEGASWGLDRVDQRENALDNRYEYRHTGAGVTVYILDTGVRHSHEEFGGRAELGFDAFGEDGSDCHGHGTHVAGTVGAATHGVAKEATLVAVRVLDCTGSGTASTVIAGLDWAAGQPARPAVVNMSLGGNASAAVDEAVGHATKAGLIVVVAAGNQAADACYKSPAGAPDAFTVGATESTDERSSFSNHGPCIDLFAPGRAIVSTWVDDDEATNLMSGTSMAAPHVAGAAALILQEAPGAAPAVVASILRDRATKGVVKSAYSEGNDLLYTLGDETQEPGNAPPIADFDAECAGLTCRFVDRSTDPDGAVVSWLWTFGDGGSSELQQPEHTYVAEGTFRATLTVTDDLGAVSGTARDLSIQSTPAVPPSADFNVSCSSLECVFTDQSSAGDAAITRWDWDFGDGSSTTSAPPPSSLTHIYDTPGEYDVGLTVTDEHGVAATARRTVGVDGITLEVMPQRVRGLHRAELQWSGAVADRTEIVVNDVLHAEVINTGHYVFETVGRGKATYRFKVCEPGGTRCSRERAVSY